MKSGIHHWLVFVGMKAVGNKFILEGRYLWFKHTQGEQWGYFLRPGSRKRREGDSARTASFFIIYYLVEEQPGFFRHGALSCQYGSSRPFSWQCSARKPYTGGERHMRHPLGWLKLLHQIFQPSYPNSSSFLTTDLCIMSAWECWFKCRFPGLPPLPPISQRLSHLG